MRNFQLYFIIIFLGLIALMLESTVFSLPLVFIWGVIFLSFYTRKTVLILVLIIGLILDSLRIINFGITPLFIFLTYSSVLLYDKYIGSVDMVVNTIILIAAILIYSYFMAYSLTTVAAVLLLLSAAFVLISLYRIKVAK